MCKPIVGLRVSWACLSPLFLSVYKCECVGTLTHAARTTKRVDKLADMLACRYSWSSHERDTVKCSSKGRSQSCSKCHASEMSF